MTQTVKLIGIGAEGKDGLIPLYRKQIEEADVLVGGERHLSYFTEHPGEKWALKNEISAMIGRIAAAMVERRIVVLASGDPLFYGIGRLLVRRLGRERVEIHPHVSSLQLAFARMGESWQGVPVESLHGRPLFGLAQRIDGRDAVALLTDELNTPGAIARYLLRFQMTEYKAFVAENLGGADERVGWWELEPLAEAEFAPLNVVILKRKDEAVCRPWVTGMADEAFAQRKPDKGLITKKEIRLLSLMELRLKEDSVVWDIGAGSGSVAIEAAKCSPHGQVYAIEKNEGDLANIEANRVKFRADIHLIHAKAPARLDELPDPDAIFIGGSGGELRQLLLVCCARLKAGGRLVVNAVTIETLSTALAGLEAEGMEVQVTLLQVARSKPILNMTRFAALNPTYVIAAWRKE
ncbi:precorrin-6y C5,15-methyltransferase (decarboxylating) subunit CbiE [Laceyella putida]|uniref:Precorrin-6y C5,15-methyltransferase (Decarboxylating) subunit CbiE n=1 Tax=Laceyella putida TaxID=110101 RepID=A0ABW2RHC9_9BACL